ncbi:MAG: hypothetical protein ABI634_12360 [Acidobacteriota bacterium]
MATRKTWVWVVAGVAGVGLVGLMAVAGGGVYFVSHHVQSEHASGADAIRGFQSVITSLGSPRPLYELDAADQPRLTRSFRDIPSATSHAENLLMLAWDPEQDRLVRVSLPFWLLRIGSRKVRIMHNANGFDFERLNLDMDELERIGPTLVFDFRNQDGARVLLWTR